LCAFWPKDATSVEEELARGQGSQNRRPQQELSSSESGGLPWVPTIFLRQLGRSEGDVRAGMPGNALEAQVAIEELASCARVLANASTLRVTRVEVNAVTEVWGAENQIEY
jgi:hypothetical protein